MTTTPLSELDRAAADFRNALLRRDDAALKRLMAAYRPAYTRMQARVAALTAQIATAQAAGETVRPSWLVEQGRLETLQRQIVAEWARFAAIAEQVITDTQRAAVEAASADAQQLTLAALDDASGGTLAVEPNVTQLHPAAMQDLVGVLSDGSPLKTLLDQLGVQAAQDVGDALTHAIAVGQNPRKTARAMRDALGGDLHRALTIARTEHLRAYRTASLRNYQENSDILRGWLWRASPSRRTCPVCLAMDGTEHGLDEALASHPACRCTMVPLLIDRPTPERETGAEWFAKQDEATQRQMLGPAKQQLYAEGKLTLADLVGVKEDARWGKSRYQRSLREIQSGHAKPIKRPTHAPPMPPAVTPAASARARLEHVDQRTKAKLAEMAQEITALQQRRDELGERKLLAPTHKERQQARKELDATRTKLDHLRYQRDTLEAEAPELLRSQIYTHSPTQVQHTIDSAVPDVQRPGIETGIKVFERMVELPMPHLTVAPTTQDRSFYEPGTNMFKLANAKPVNFVAPSTIHEMGHWLEENHLSVQHAVRAFLDRRTAGETDTPLALLAPRKFNASEMTRVDQFRDAYVGKQYRDPNGSYYATEVLSMGLEWFYTDPLAFAREDPDMFDVIYNAVRKPV